MGKHFGTEPCWHATSTNVAAYPKNAAHVAVFSHYPHRTIALTYRMGATPHLRRLMGNKPLRYLFWTTKP